MEFTIERLMKGDREIADHYQRAARRWIGITTGAGDPVDVAKLADKLRNEQTWFENNCGGQRLGQEIMATVGLGHLYDLRSGFGDLEPVAHDVAEAFHRSMCSLEVKGYAREAAELYGLDDE